MTFPAGTETLELDIDSGIHMRAYARGNGSRLVIFCHGFPELAHSWHNQLAAVPQGYRFVAPDMRGYGGTDAPKRVRDYDITKLVADVVALGKALGADRFDLVGHDWGGAVAWEVARRAPERVRSLTVLNCPPGDLMTRELRTNRAQLKMSWYMLFFQLPFFPERYFKRDPKKLVRATFRKIAVNKEPFTPEALVPYVEQVELRGLPGVNYYRAARGALFNRKPPPMVHTPTRLIWGLGDGALGPWFADKALYSGTADHFDIVTIERSGHWVQQEAPEEVNAALLAHLASVHE